MPSLSGGWLVQEVGPVGDARGAREARRLTSGILSLTPRSSSDGGLVHGLASMRFYSAVAQTVSPQDGLG